MPGKTEAEAAAEGAVYSRGVGYKGIATARAWTHVMSCPRADTSFRPNLNSTRRVLQAGDLVMLELGTVVDGFWSDLTRTRATGKPIAKQLEVHGIVAEAQAVAMKAMKLGTIEKGVDRATRCLPEKAGCGEYFVHPVNDRGYSNNTRVTDQDVNSGWRQLFER